MKKLFMIFIIYFSFYNLLGSSQTSILKQELEQETVSKEIGMLEELEVLKAQNISKEIRDFILEDKHLEVIVGFFVRISDADPKYVQEKLLAGYDKDFDSCLYLYDYLKVYDPEKYKEIDFKQLAEELKHKVGELGSCEKINYLDALAIRIAVGVLKKYLESEKKLNLKDCFDAIKKDYFNV